jgi:uncharacterized membrane protein YccC
MSELTGIAGNPPRTELSNPPSGWEYAIRISLGCAVAWYVLHLIGLHIALWALISVIIVTEPELSAAWMAFLSRIVNTFIGAAVGLPLLYLFGPEFWSVLLGITISVLICTHLIKIPGSWRVAPVTVAIVMMPSVLAASRSAGLSTAIDRTEEVLVGSGVALLTTFGAAVIERWLHRLNEYRAARRRAI